MKRNLSLDQWKQGLLDAGPIALSIILFGTIFGMLCLQAGLSAWDSVAMSMFVFAGASQFTALSMLSDSAGIWSIILATFLLNSRHFLMGLSMSPYYRSFSKSFINISAFFLIDEQYALTLNRFRHHPSNKSYIITVGLTFYFCWNVGTWMGTVAGSWIPDPNALGLGFSFTAMFLALVYYQLVSILRIVTFLICGGLAVSLVFVLPNGLHLLGAGVIAFMIGYFTQPADIKEVKSA